MMKLETQTLPKMHDIIAFLEAKDPYVIQKSLLDIQKCIPGGGKRIFKAEDVLNIYKQASLRERVEQVRIIKNLEFLKKFFAKFPELKKYKKRLIGKHSLENTFEEVLGKHNKFRDYKKMLDLEKETFQTSITKAENIRKDYLGKSVSEKGMFPLVLKCTTVAPFGSNRIAPEAIADIVHYHLGFGFYGESLTWDILNSRYGNQNYIQQQFAHPTLQYFPEPVG